jgi:hypothetical protein
MEVYVDASPKVKKFIEALLPSLMEQTGINVSKKFLHIKTDKDIQDMGQTIPLLGIDTYLVVLKTTRNFNDLGLTLAHELVHVAQMTKGILKITPKGRKWRGKFYSNKHPYLYQPWEVQAFSKQEILFRRAID